MGITYKKFFNNKTREKIRGIDFFLYIILTGFTMLTIANVWVYIAENFLYNLDFVKKSFDSFSQVNQEFSKNGFLSILLDVGILGPIQEELIFRGLIYNILKK